MERSSGWFAADGIFSDTYIGEEVNNVPKPGNVMVNNSAAWMTGVEPD